MSTSLNWLLAAKTNKECERQHKRRGGGGDNSSCKSTFGRSSSGMDGWSDEHVDPQNPYAPDCASRAAEGFYVGALYGASFVLWPEERLDLVLPFGLMDREPDVVESFSSPVPLARLAFLLLKASFLNIHVFCADARLFSVFPRALGLSHRATLCRTGGRGGMHVRHDREMALALCFPNASRRYGSSNLSVSLLIIAFRTSGFA